MVEKRVLWVLLTLIVILITGVVFGLVYYYPERIAPPAVDSPVEVVTVSVVYHSNQADQGLVPVDYRKYESGTLAAVLGNTGNLGRDGYVFDGWNTRADGSGVGYKGGEYAVVGETDLHLYAQWKPVYAVHYDANQADSGGVPLDDALYAPGDSTAVIGNTGNLVRIGYTFEGWNTRQDGTGDAYRAGDQLTIGDADVTLYAHWKPYTAKAPPRTDRETFWVRHVLTPSLEEAKEVLGKVYLAGFEGEIWAEPSYYTVQSGPYLYFEDAQEWAAVMREALDIPDTRIRILMPR